MVAVFIFVVTYLLITVRRLNLLKLDRPSAALIGAVAMVAAGVLAPEEALAAVDGRTMLLLFGVMGLGVLLEQDGVFGWAERRLVARVRTPQAMLGWVIWVSGLASAFVTNDAVAILAAPVVLRLVDRYGLSPMPFLLGLATAVNTGSVATVVGNPQNMLCASFGGLAYRDFLLAVGPIALGSLVLNHAWVAWFFRRELGGKLNEEFRNDGSSTSEDSVSFWGVWVILGVAFAALLGADIAFGALGGLALLLVFKPGSGVELFKRLDWSILVFFGGLFVVVEGFLKTGWAAEFFTNYPLVELEKMGVWATSLVFLLGSNVFSNVPFILVVRDALAGSADPKALWTLLAVASTFAGNLTLLGSVANIIVAEAALERVHIGFWEHLKVGFPLAVVTTALGAWWLA